MSVDARAIGDERIAAATTLLQARGFGGPYDCALVLGTGLGDFADEIAYPQVIAYEDIPHFPSIGVSGHRGRLIAGRIGDARILAFQGRSHYYETGDAAAMKIPIGVVACLGRPPLLLTNAAGAVCPDFAPGSPVLICDHINLAGVNPLIGVRGDGRFVSMVYAYDEGLRIRMRAAAAQSAIALAEGTYLWVSGPSFETPAEIRMAGLLGADLVGMSTVPEVILARYYDVRVVALSLVTNAAAGLVPGGHSHAETQAVAAAAAPRMRRLVRAFLARMGEDD